MISASAKFWEGFDKVIVNVTSCDVESPVLKDAAAVVASAAVIVTVGAEVSDVTENFDTAAFPLPAASVNTFSASDTDISVPSAAAHLSKYTYGAGAGAPVASHAGELHPVAVTSPSTKSAVNSLTVKLNVIADGLVASDVAAPFVSAVAAPSAAVIVTVGAVISEFTVTALTGSL